MKTLKIKSIKLFTIGMLAAALISITACGGNQGNTEKEKSIKAEEAIPKPPDMDLPTATFLGDLNAVKQHIAAGSDLNVREPAVGSSPLITAAVFGKTEVALALIEGGADLNLKNNEGSTALHSAAFLCRTEIVESLLKNGADKSLRNNAGATAYESVAGSYDDVKFIYDIFSKDLGPLGLKLDYDQIEETRPIIAKMLE